MQKAFWFSIIFVITLSLAGCGGNAQDAPGKAVEAYLQAIVSGDDVHIATLSCTSWEETAQGEVASFVGVKARLEGLACTSRSLPETEAVVDCKGSIVATYNNEDSDIPLDGRSFKVVQQDGNWLVCGYGE